MLMWQQNNRETLQNISSNMLHKFSLFNLEYPNSPQFRIYQLPSFNKWTAWTVFHNSENKRTVTVKRLTWRQDIDNQRSHDTPPWLFSDKPTLEESQVDLSLDKFDMLMQEGMGISISVVNITRPFGLDGTPYGFIQKDVHLKWWESGPKEWKFFTEWVTKMIEFFEDTIQS